ncbi:MAG: DUF5660 domain-containing protein [Candidatus Shapirobacteria bacterium]|nr:DUF5660 domain-containing protein [Candidatus Shapirobacteria bacterium]
MAGGNSFTKNPQKGNKYNSVFNNTEILNDSVTHSNNPTILDGILRPGESINFKKEQNPSEKPKFIDYIGKEQSLFINQHQNEVERTINELRAEIKKLVQITENVGEEIKQAVDQNVAEISQYQLNFFERIKNFIVNFRKNISEASAWIESFNSKKNKRNAYWNKAKSGGTKYTESGEHSVARSAN